MFGRSKAETAPRTEGFSWCENWAAGPTSPQHIRQTTSTGLHLGGGVDTAALCGREMTWDLGYVRLQEVMDSVPHQHETFRICSGCLAAVESLLSPV